jgi:hypothetical protein
VQPGCMIAWGLLSGTTAFVTSFGGLVTVRFLLGFVEAYVWHRKCKLRTNSSRPFFPGALFLLSSWYTKRELALRTSILYAGSLLAGAFGGLLAASVEYFFGGFLGINSWRWMFLMQSSCTIILAVSSM